MKCPCCSGALTMDTAQLGFGLPDEVFALPEAERNDRALLGDDLVLLKPEGRRLADGPDSKRDRGFVRTVMDFRVVDPEHPEGLARDWTIGVWVEIGWRDFAWYAEHFAASGVARGPARGTLANDLPGYPPLRGVAVDVVWQPGGKRPLARFVGTGHPLAREQKTGMPKASVHALLASRAPN